MQLTDVDTLLVVILDSVKLQQSTGYHTTVQGRKVQMARVIHKTELSKMVAERLGISQAAARDATSAVLGSIVQALSENDRVTLTGFGTFSVMERAAWRMRPNRGDNAGRTIHVPARKYVVFKAGNTLEQTLRDGRQAPGRSLPSSPATAR